MENGLQGEGFVKNLLCKGKVGHIEQISTARTWTNITKVPAFINNPKQKTDLKYL